MKTNHSSDKKFSRLVIITIIAVYLLILAGGIVRSTGSGMGCPDWPKCFGSWMPPTSEAQLPSNYQEIFAEVRVKKNQRLAGYLSFFGFNELAEALQAEYVALPEAPFNKSKTWTEYINRLLGVVVGMLITAVAVLSFGFRQKQPAIVYGSVAALVLVVFQGWLGSVVVSSNLLPGLVTIHMIPAIILICLLLFLLHKSIGKTPEQIQLPVKPIKVVLILSIILFCIQVVVGTQVREAVDLVALEFGQMGRDQWISNLGGSFYLHRSFSLVILAATGYLYIMLHRTGHEEFLQLAKLLLVFIFIEVILGIYMAYFGIPAWAQPLHLFAALFSIGLMFWMYLRTKNLQTV